MLEWLSNAYPSNMCTAESGDTRRGQRNKRQFNWVYSPSPHKHSIPLPPYVHPVWARSPAASHRARQPAPPTAAPSPFCSSTIGSWCPSQRYERYISTFSWPLRPVIVWSPAQFAAAVQPMPSRLSQRTCAPQWARRCNTPSGRDVRYAVGARFHCSKTIYTACNPRVTGSASAVNADKQASATAVTPTPDSCI